MFRDRTTGPFHEPKLFNFKLCLMRRTDHKNGTPSVARRPRLFYINAGENMADKMTS